MRNPDRQTTFRFKQFEVSNCKSAMKVGTDGVLLGAWAFRGEHEHAASPTRILDVGCGTGVIALMMAQRFPEAAITGVEIDPDAAAEAAMNFKSSPWSGRLDAVCADFIEYSDCECGHGRCGKHGFDLIVANPPFFTNGALAPDVSRRTARHEGTLDLPSLVTHASRLLKPCGRIGIILPAEQHSRVEFLAALSGLSVTRVCHVKTVAHKAPRRVLCELAWPSSPAGAEVSAGGNDIEFLTLQTPDGCPGAEYVNLVDPFYLKIK